MSGFVILQPSGDSLDFVDCTPSISPTLAAAQQELAEWYDDTPDAAIYRLEKVEDPADAERADDSEGQ